MLLRNIDLDTLIGFTYLPVITHRIFPTDIQRAMDQCLCFCCPLHKENGVAKRKWWDPRELSTLENANYWVLKSLCIKNKEISIIYVRGWGLESTLRQRTQKPSFFSKHHFGLLQLLNVSLSSNKMLVLSKTKMPWAGTLMTYSNDNSRSYISTLWENSLE